MISYLTDGFRDDLLKSAFACVVLGKRGCGGNLRKKNCNCKKMSLLKF